MSPVAGAGVEQAAGGIAQQCIEINAFKSDTLAQQQPEYRRDDQCSDGDEDQRVRKMPVKLDVEQRVIAGTDQNIGICR